MAGNKVIEYIIRAKDMTSNGINSAVSRVRGMSSAMGAAFKGIGANLMNIKAGFDMVLAAARTFANAFISVIKEAFKFETAVANFKTLLGSMDEAKSHIAELKQFASQTPLTFEDLSQASKTLLSFGASVDTIMPSLKMLGDISLGDAQKFKGLALVFAQVQSQGKLMGQDLLQMVNQGFNPLTIIAQETGKSMSELKELMGDGAISFKMVEEAMRIATAEGGRFHGAMEESAKTGEGMVSTLKDNWSEAVRTFGDAFSGAAKSGIQIFIDKLQQLQEDGSIAGWAEVTANYLNVLIKAFSAVGSAVSFVWKGIKGTFGTAMAFAQGADQAILEGNWKDMFSRGADVALNYWNAEILGENQAQSAPKKKPTVKPKGKSLSEMLQGGGASAYRKEIANEIEQAKAKVQELEEIFKFDPTDDIALARLELAEDYAEALAECTSKEEKKELDSIAKIEQAKIDTEEKLRKMEDANLKKAEQERKKQEAEEEKERKELEKRIAQERKRIQSDLQRELQEAEAEQANAESALEQAQDKVRQAWGWYRDKDSLKAQIEEEKAEAAAQKQFEKDFEKLKSRRYDWRTADNLSLDDEAVRRVGLAMEEEKAALEYARQTAESSQQSAAALEAIQQAMEEG